MLNNVGFTSVFVYPVITKDACIVLLSLFLYCFYCMFLEVLSKIQNKIKMSRAFQFPAHPLLNIDQYSLIHFVAYKCDCRMLDQKFRTHMLGHTWLYFAPRTWRASRSFGLEGASFAGRQNSHSRHEAISLI